MEAILRVVTGVIVSAIVLLASKLVYNELEIRRRWQKSKIPGPPRYPIIGSIISRSTTSFSMFQKQATYGAVSVLFPLNNPIVLTSDPEDIKRIFTSHVIPKGNSMTSLGSYLGPSGIVFLDHAGPDMKPWKPHRQAIDQAFRVSSLRNFQPIVTRHAKELIQRLEKYDGEVIDMIEEFKKTVFSVTSSLIGAGNAPAGFPDAMYDLISSLNSPLIRLRIPLAGSYQRWLKRRSFQIVDGFLNEAIRVKQAELAHLTTEELASRESTTLLELLFLTNQFTPTQIRDHLVIFYLAGLDTTASLLPSALFQIVQHPEVCHRVVNELDSVPSPLAYDDLKKLRYTMHCIEESLRMRGPVIVTARELVQDYELACGEVVPARTLLLPHLHGVHYSDKWWTDPQRYNPSRFDKDENGGVAEPRHPFAYVPFATGPRICIGRNLFFSEALTLLHGILTHFSFEIIDHPDNGLVSEGHGLCIPKMAKFRATKRQNSG